MPCLPRGIPAASLKRSNVAPDTVREVRLPRGIPAASLKRSAPAMRSHCSRYVFRGEYPRPH